MKTLFSLVLMLFSCGLHAQWTTLYPDSLNDRIEDICFLDYQNGFAATSLGYVYKTVNGGKTWSSTLLNDTAYFRTIEFATPSLGFIGTLDKLFYTTTDGGQTWQEISYKLDSNAVAICGLSAPTSNVIYGCGAFYRDGYIIKSLDAGNSWSFIDMSAYASALVDIHFVSQDTGFVAGRAKNKSEGGIILYTTDGGISWVEKIKTNRADEYVWKIQSPDGKHYFGSIEPSGLSVGQEIYFLKSNNSGQSWTKDTLSSNWTYIQTIGFLDSLHGWSGGDHTLYETKDGGHTWHVDTLVNGSKYNRFIRIDGETGFLTGQNIYLFSPGTVWISEHSFSTRDIHKMQVKPNPTSNEFILELNLSSKTNCLLELFSADGRFLETIDLDTKQKGKYEYAISLKPYLGSVFYVTLKTNEKHYYEKVIRTQ